MTDVYLYQSDNDGEIDIEQGEVLMTAGLESAVFMSLFGGDFRDDGAPGNRKQWWGNATTSIEAEKQTSRLQHYIAGAPATSANLLKAEDLAGADLAWLIERGYSVDIEASIPALNKIGITVSVEAETFEFIEDWATL